MSGVRALVIVLDSVGIGHAPDAAKYGDEGANTLGHIFEQTPDLQLPNLCALGLPEIVDLARPKVRPPYLANFGKMQERSAGKDTTTGHWEIAGVIIDEPFAVFEKFPDELVRAIEREADVKFIGNYARSGTTILQELGRNTCGPAIRFFTRRPIQSCKSQPTKTCCQSEDFTRFARLPGDRRIDIASAA